MRQRFVRLTLRIVPEVESSIFNLGDVYMSTRCYMGMGLNVLILVLAYEVAQGSDCYSNATC